MIFMVKQLGKRIYYHLTDQTLWRPDDTQLTLVKKTIQLLIIRHHIVHSDVWNYF